MQNQNRQGRVIDIPDANMLANFEQIERDLEEKERAQFAKQQMSEKEAVREAAKVGMQYEKDLLDAKKQKKDILEGRDRLSAGAKKRIEILLGMHREFVEVTILNVKYKLRTLTSSETREVAKIVLQYAGSIEHLYESRRQTLARSLVSINGMAIEEFLLSESLEDRLYFIDQLDEHFITTLNKAWETVNKNSVAKFLPKTEQEAEEVAQDIKKS